VSNEFFEQTVINLTRKGAEDRVRLLKNLHKKVLPSQLERIQKNDKSVLQEMFMPKWVSWELLRAWADNVQPMGKGKQCILCDEKKENGIDFNERFICESCFVRLKQLE